MTQMSKIERGFELAGHQQKDNFDKKGLWELDSPETWLQELFGLGYSTGTPCKQSRSLD